MIKEINCVVCDKIIIALNGDQARRKFCSGKCRNHYNNRNTKGKQNFCIDCKKQINIISKRCRICAYKKRDLNEEKNGRWKGGTSFGYQLRIYSSVLKDNGIDLDLCQKCGIKRSKYVKMHIHHKDENRKNNKFENLINWCSKCHHRHHKCKDMKKSERTNNNL